MGCVIICIVKGGRQGLFKWNKKTFCTYICNWLAKQKFLNTSSGDGCAKLEKAGIDQARQEQWISDWRLAQQWE